MADPFVDVNLNDDFGHSPLMLLCLKNRSESFDSYVEKLIQRPDVNVRAMNNERCNALHIICSSHRLHISDKLIVALIRKGIDIADTNKDGMKSLDLLCEHYAGVNVNDLIRHLQK